MPDAVIDDAVSRAIERQRAEDPRAGVKVGAQEVLQRVLKALNNERGVHFESLLCALGAMAGYACQASVRATALSQGLPETAFLTTVDTVDGQQFFFGDPLNKHMIESQLSVWNLALAAAQENGAQQAPDANELFTHVAKTVGSADFGLPRLPDGHQPGDTPLNFLIVMWPVFFDIAKQYCQEPDEVSVMFGLAVQRAMIMGKDTLAPELALRIVLECAVPMSKVNLGAYLQPTAA